MFEKALDHKPVEVKAPAQNPSDYFGVMVFGRVQMRKYLNKQIYNALLDTIENNTPLSADIADAVAAGMRQWALENGADQTRQRQVERKIWKGGSF